MVKVTFKLSDTDTVNLELKEPTKLEDVLKISAELVGIELGGFIAIRSGTVITSDHLVDLNDAIDIYPAISGG